MVTFRKQFSDCKLRVFSLANRKDELDRETRNMAALLAKFRIDFSSVLVIPGNLQSMLTIFKNKWPHKSTMKIVYLREGVYY